MITFETHYENIDGQKATHHHTITIHNHDSFQHIQKLFQRALNTWPDAHPELKELGDKLIHGYVLQDYYSQRTDKQLIAPSDC